MLNTMAFTHIYVKEQYSASSWWAAFLNLLFSGNDVPTVFWYNWQAVLQVSVPREGKGKKVCTENIHLVQRGLTSFLLTVHCQTWVTWHLLEAGGLRSVVGGWAVAFQQWFQAVGLQALKSHVRDTSSLNSVMRDHQKNPSRIELDPNLPWSLWAEQPWTQHT